MILENKHHICLLAAALTAGILLAGEHPSVQHVFPAVLLLFACAAGMYKKHPSREQIVMLFLVTGFCLLGAGITRQHLTSYTGRQKIISSTAPVTLCGTVTGKEIKSDSYLYHLKQTYLNTDQTPVFLGHIIFSNETDVIPIGAKIKITGKVQCFSPARNDGNFDFADYYQQQNILCRLRVENGEDAIQIKKIPALLCREQLYRLQKHIVQIYTEQMNQRDAGILCTLAAGTKSLLDPEIKQQYQEAGISHLLSVSGLHISILGFSVYRFLRFLRRSYPCSAAVSTFCILCFSYMSGFGIPAQRAIVMYLCMMGAQIFGRTYDGAHGLALAAILLLITNPLTLYQTGFLFSFTAMLAIVQYSRLFPEQEDEKRTDHEGNRKSIYAWIKNNLRNRLTDLKKNLLFSLWLQLWILPMTAWFYYEVPLYAMFLNLLILPFSSWLLGGGLIAALIYVWMPGIAGWILVTCHAILTLYDAGMRILRLFPGNLLLTGQPEPFWIITYYIVLAFFCLWKLYRKLFAHNKNVRWLSLKGLPYGILGIFLAATLLVHPAETPGIFLLDVGQGDGIFLTDGHGGHIWIDGGSSSEAAVGTYRMLPFLKYHRVNAVDVWIVTHPDADHISGLEELLEQGYPVHRLLLAKALSEDSSCQKLAELAKKQGTSVSYVDTGDTLHLKEMTLQCLYPDADETAADCNGLSQVWELRSHAFSMLFTGDLGEEQEKLLLKRQRLHPVTALKVAHHGSRFSSCEEFLNYIHPKAAFISSSAHNRYHHPSKEALERLEKEGCDIYCTKDCGQISILYRKGQWQIRQ